MKKLLTNYFLRATVPPVTPRQTATERREAILEAAILEIAAKGFASATTAGVARRAGISQPYVFRFFPTKKDLALAVVDRCVSRILGDWEKAVPLPGESRLDCLGRTYLESLPQHRAELLVKFHGYAAADDPDVAEALRHHLARLFRYVVLQASRDGHENPHAAAALFIGQGFFINAAMAIGLESVLTPEEWAGICPMPDVARVDDLPEASAA